MREHQEMIAATLPRLGSRLEDVTNMLQNPSRAASDRIGDAWDEWSRLAEERAYTLNCIAICETARQEIAHQQVI